MVKYIDFKKKCLQQSNPVNEKDESYEKWFEERANVYKNIRDKLSLLHESVHGNNKSDINNIFGEYANLYEFINLCKALEKIIDNLIRDTNDYNVVEEYQTFKKQLISVKNLTIVEAYNNDCFLWNFEKPPEED